MSDILKQLQAALVDYKDQVWLLQNHALQLKVEGPNSEACSTLADGLEDLRRRIATVAPAALVDRLAMDVLDLRSGALTPQAATAVFSRIEALSALIEGDDEEIRRQLADASSGDSPHEPETTTAVRNEGHELVDDISSTDTEDLQLFAAEVRDHLKAMELSLLEFEGSTDLELIRDIFRDIHSIKGGAQYLGLEATATLSHRVETLLDRIRSETITLDRNVLSSLLKSVDVLTDLIDAVENGVPTTVDAAAMVREVEQHLAMTTSEPSDSNPTPTVASGGRAKADIPAHVSEEAHGPAPDSDDKIAAGDDTASRNFSDFNDLEDDELFRAEFTENLESANELLADLQRLVADPDRLTVATRNLHSLKGLAGLVEITAIESVALSMDRLVTKATRHRTEMPPDIGRAITEGLALLRSMFDEYVASGSVTTDIEKTVATLNALTDREDRLVEWQAPDPWQTIQSQIGAGPLARSFGALIDGLRNNQLSAARHALEDLIHDAEMLGHDEMVEECRRLVGSLAELTTGQLVDRVQALSEMAPADPLGWRDDDSEDAISFEDIALAIPGIGKKKLERIRASGYDSVDAVAAASPVALAGVPGVNLDQAKMLFERCSRIQPNDEPELSGADLVHLDRRVLDETHDVELVQIYLETTARQIDASRGAVNAGEIQTGIAFLHDLANASRYMDLEPLTRWFRSALDLVQCDPPRLDHFDRFMTSIRKEVERLRLLQERTVQVGPPPTSDVEKAELERIFREAAENHLARLKSDLFSFFVNMNGSLLKSVQHHASCLHSGATNIGLSQASETAEALVETVELAWLNPEQVTSETCHVATAQLQQLYAACGFDAPDLEIPDLDAVSPPPRERTTTELDDDDIDSVFGDLLSPDISAAPSTRHADAAPAETSKATVSANRAEAAPQPPESGRVPDETIATPAPSSAGSDAGGSVPEDPEPASVARGLVDAQSTVRVDTAKIDALMNMMAELVVNRSSFMVLSNTVNELMSRLIDADQIGTIEARELRAVLARYDEAMNDLGRVSNQLQQGVMRIRMMPIRTLFSRIPRLVRELGLREHRSVTLSCTGEDTELDKKVLERLSDPIVHIVRNAISHGIESPDERRAAGKPAEGRLQISAHHQGNIVVIEIEDDGRGIDFNKVREQLENTTQGAKTSGTPWSDRELQAAIFLPGFSTSKSVTDVSGRGVGLDVVKRNVEGLGGQVDVVSKPGEFCRFTIRIPLTMAIMQALLVRVDSEVYAIPVSSVIEAEFIQRDAIYSVENQQVIAVRDTVIPLIQLDQVFAYNYHLEQTTGSEVSTPSAERNGEDSVYVVVLQGDGREVGMVVNELIGTQDIVIKSLEDELVDARGIAGASILGDGTVTLILDVGELQRMVVDGHTSDVRRSNSLRQLEKLLRERGDLGLESIN